MARYLKSIEIQGFKSFPNKTEIELVDGITGIVGANGCGKSNIVESLKWVLGEQSAKSLRGEKMEDVIFNGTKNRSPLSMADVTLTFDNYNHWLPLDYNEVAISRRIFRSGEGQYSINKSKVRLKDVVELFLDTGVGRDSYAIFEQGKIDRLLSESPMERRILFEDFAGISRFKFRKEEAERKLENARANIERVNDVIMNLEKEVVSLKEQAENASRYNELRADLRLQEMKFQALRVKNFESEIKTKSDQKKNAEAKLAPLQETMKEREEALIVTENDIQARETDLNAQRDKLSRAERDFTEVKSRMESNRERKKLLENQIKTMESRLEEGEERRKVLQNELETKMTEFDQASEDKEEISDRILDIQSRIDAIQGDMKGLDARTLSKSKSLGFERIVSKDDIDKQKHELISLQARMDNFRQSMEEKWEQVKTIQAEMDEKKNLFEMAAKETQSLKSELEKILSEIDENHKKESNIKTENTRLADEIKVLQAKLKSMDRVIMESLEKQSGLIKDFSEKKPMFEAKIDSAMEALHDAVKNNGGTGEVDSAIAKLKALFKEYQNSYESILGILYSDEGTYTQKENTQKAIEDITTKAGDNEVMIERLRARVKELQGVREELQNTFNKNDFEQNSLKNELKKMEQQASTVQESLKMLENQLNSASESIKKKQTLIEELLGIVDEYEEEMREFRATRAERFEELQRIKVDAARSEEKVKSLQNELSRIKSQINDIDRVRQNFENDRKSSMEVITELSGRIEQDQKQLESLESRINELKEENEKLKEALDGLQKARKGLERERRELEEMSIKLEKTVASLENAITERQTFLDGILASIQNDFQADIHTVPLEAGESLDSITARIATLRGDIQNLGDVNLLAIEQYQNAKERLEFLLIQRQDSEKAIEDILALIEETNARSIEQFSAAFEDIRKAFKKIFTRLFEGGRADLILEDEKDILNSGINIFAEPPGKKFQAISLMSGGERALVAIAVIFSILYLKPTPFVVLDEMDAPLDDDNIERFKRLVMDFRDTSQFIMVSHSKSTLEICDALYGVTMEEQGCSKVVSVAFDEANLLFKKEDEPESLTD